MSTDLETRYRALVEALGGRATLVAVSKKQPVEAVQALYALGHRDFGENTLAGLELRAAALPADARWHFMGTIQRNKLRRILARASVLHSVDRESVVNAIVRICEEESWPLPEILLQVNLGDEPQKSGVAPWDLFGLVNSCLAAGVEPAGLMILPPADWPPEQCFDALVELRDQMPANAQCRLPKLSMGMSADYLAALDRGSSYIRVGTALFGERSEPV